MIITTVKPQYERTLKSIAEDPAILANTIAGFCIATADKLYVAHLKNAEAPQRA